MDWLLNLFTYFSSCSNIASTRFIMSFSPQFIFFINFFPLIPFPFCVHFVFWHVLSCLSLFLLSPTPVHHISFTQLLILASSLPRLNGQGERSELDLLPCREQEAALREAEGLCCVHAWVCVHVWDTRPLTAGMLQTALIICGCWLFNPSLAGMLECICLKANRAQWPGLSWTKAGAQCRAAARALWSRR